MSPSVLIFGFGYLGRPLAVKLSEHGYNVRAVKRRLTSDDINLPVQLDCLPLTSDSRLPEWASYPVWILLLPPSSVPNYAAAVGNLADYAQACGVQHLIFTSSTGIYGDRARDCFEDGPAEAQTESTRQIVAAEQALLQTAIPHLDILRLGGLYCAARHPLYSLQHKTIPNPQAAANMLHRDRAVAALFQAACTPSGQRIRNLVETPHPSRREFYCRQATLLGLPEPQFADSSQAGKRVFSRFDDLMPSERQSVTF